MADEISKKSGDDEPQPSWVSPKIHSPTKREPVYPGFEVQVLAEFGGSEWSAEFYTGPHLIKKMSGDFPGKEWFEFRVPENLIEPGLPFYFKVDYYAWPAWSSWAWSNDLMLSLRKPVIKEPTPNYAEFNKIYGSGFPGATITLVEAGSGVIVYGTATVDKNGGWEATLTQSLPEGSFPMTANQKMNSAVSEWADTVNFPALRQFNFTFPKNNTVVNRKPLLRGVGHPGATVVFVEKDHGGNIYGTTVVNENGTWETFLTENLPARFGFYLAAQQKLNGVTSGWVDLKLNVLPVAAGVLESDD